MGRGVLTGLPPGLAEALGRRGFSVIRTDDLDELRVRAHVSEAHSAFRRDAIRAMRDIRTASLDARLTRHAAVDVARRVSGEFLHRHTGT